MALAVVALAVQAAGDETANQVVEAAAEPVLAVETQDATVPEAPPYVGAPPPAVPPHPVTVTALPDHLYEMTVGNGVVVNGIDPGDAQNLVSISLESVPVPDVVNMFSRISGANIIVAGTFTNLYVTANLRDVEWKSALRLTLGSVNLSMIEDPSGIIMVVTSQMYQEKLRELEATKPLVTRNFIVRYLNAVDLVEQIKSLKALSPRGTIITSQSRQQHNANLKSSTLTTTSIQNPSITTEVIVTDIKEYVDRIEELIMRLDRRERQVFIEARIVDIVSGDSSKVGFDWSMLERFGVTAGLSDLRWDFADTRRRESTTTKSDLLYDDRRTSDDISRFYDLGGRGIEETVTSYEEHPPGSGNWLSRTTVVPTRRVDDNILRGRDVSALREDIASDVRMEAKTGSAILSISEASLFMSALKQTSDANMISHPLLIVGNRVEAKIHVGERYPTVFSERTVDSTGGVSRDVFSERVEWNDLGLTLWVIPEIDSDDDVVRLTVNPQMSTWIKDITTPQGSVYPVISTRHLSSRVNVPSGHTVVIGGLMENRNVKREKRVPLLGDIPLLGMLFRHTEDSKEISNLLILLTPTILDEAEPVTGMEVLAQRTIDEFQYLPLSAKKPLPDGADQPDAEDADPAENADDASSAPVAPATESNAAAGEAD